MDDTASTIARSRVEPLGPHPYSLGSNVLPYFAIGSVGSPDDFWLCGLPVPDGSPYPMLSGSLLDSKGSPVLRFVNNEVTFNPANYRRIFGTSDHGIRISFRDQHNVEILDVETEYWQSEGRLVTSVMGNFHDKAGELVVEATRGHLKMMPLVRGDLGGAIQIQSSLTKDERNFLRLMIDSRGRINRILTGEFVAVKEFRLDNAFFHDLIVRKSRVMVSDFFWPGDNVEFDSCEFSFHGLAASLKIFMDRIGSPDSLVGGHEETLHFDESPPNYE